jgi:hypothetical protein
MEPLYSNIVNRKRRTIANSKYSRNDTQMIDFTHVKLGRKRGSTNHSYQRGGRGSAASRRGAATHHHSQANHHNSNATNSISANLDLNEDQHSNNNSRLSATIAKQRQKNAPQDFSCIRTTEQIIIIPNKQSITLTNTTDQTMTNLLIERPIGITQCFLYKPFYILPDLSNYVSDLIEVRIASEYLTTKNKVFKERILFGSDNYTSNSDCVLLLQHSGYLLLESSAPTNYTGISLYLRVQKSRSSYNSTTKYGIKSSKISSFQGHSIKPEGFSILSSLGSEEEITQMAAKMTISKNKLLSNCITKPNSVNLSNLIISSTDVPFISNLSFEPSFRYSISAIVDKSYDNPKEFLSYKLKTKVLYLETQKKRYEISRVNKTIDKAAKDKLVKNSTIGGNEVENLKEFEISSLAECGAGDTDEEMLFEKYERFRIAEVICPFSKDNNFMLDSKVNIPLTDSNINIIYSNLDWGEFIWGVDFLKIKTSVISGLVNFKFYSIK